MGYTTAIRSGEPHETPPYCPTRRRHAGRTRPHGPRAGLPGQADQADHCLSRRWADRHHHAFAGRQRQQDPGSAGDRGEQARRRRHAAGAGAAVRPGGRLHRRPDSAGRVPPALHHQDQLGPGEGHQLRAQRHRLRLRPRRARRFATQDLDAFRRLGQGQPRQAHLRLHRHPDQPAPDHGADRAEARTWNCCTCPTRAAPT